MDRDHALRDHLRKLLDWEDAHISLDRAIDGVDPANRGEVPPGLPHSLWQLVEHLRRTQFDILDFCRNPDYAELASDEYWPSAVAPPSAAAWRESIDSFRRDREELKKLAMDAKIDLFAKISRGSGQTYLRELILVADHTAYHTGQIVAVRRALGDWAG